MVELWTVRSLDDCSIFKLIIRPAQIKTWLPSLIVILNKPFKLLFCYLVAMCDKQLFKNCGKFLRYNLKILQFFSCFLCLCLKKILLSVFVALTERYFCTFWLVWNCLNCESSSIDNVGVSVSVYYIFIRSVLFRSHV